MKFAKVCRVLRIVFLPFLLMFMLATGAVAVEYFMPEILGSTTPKEEVLMSLTNCAVYTVVFLVAEIIFIAFYRKHKKAIKQENAASTAVHLGKKRKTKIFFRVIGIITIAMGAFLYIAHPVASWLVIVGIGFLVISFVIRVRKHVASGRIHRDLEGNKMSVTYPSKPESNTFHGYECAEVIQDTINDGYTTFESFTSPQNGQVRFTFSTKLSQKEMQKQYERRDEFFRTKDASNMPDFFSEKPTIYSTSDESLGSTFKQKEPVYKTEYYDVYKGGEKIREETKQVFSHYVYVTYQHVTTTYKFYNKNDNSPFKDKRGEHFIVVVRSTKEIGRERA